MKQYPSINGQISYEFPVYVWDKLDGSNIRAEWSKKNGFYKFGTRERLLDSTDKVFGIAPKIIIEKYNEELSKIFFKYQWTNVVCFFEYYGDESFAGSHNLEKPLTTTLIDVSIHKKGFLLSKDFYNYFGHLDIPKLLYTGKINANLIEQIKNSTLKEMTFEGVICKGPYKSPGLPWMFKIKRNY